VQREKKGEGRGIGKCVEKAKRSDKKYGVMLGEYGRTSTAKG
jgi:hypothetical protein